MADEQDRELKVCGRLGPRLGPEPQPAPQAASPQQQDARINAVDGDHGRPAAARDGLPVYGVFGVLYATSFCSGFQTVS